jgi:hypothetical protein
VPWSGGDNPHSEPFVAVRLTACLLPLHLETDIAVAKWRRIGTSLIIDLDTFFYNIITRNKLL